MPSKDYLKMLEEIPKDIQREVDNSLAIANEIVLILEEKSLLASDLAKMLGKSESEISKWLTGTHNFTIKTISKIEAALDSDIFITYSDKIASYETTIIELIDKISILKNETLILRSQLHRRDFKPLQSHKYPISNLVKEEKSRYVAHFRMEQVSDSVKIISTNKSKVSLQYE